jgi:uncharacterized protein YbaR (Trm112 family)
MLGNQPVPPTCPECRGPMVLVRTIPRLGALPELFGFYCAPCRRAETIEHTVGATMPMMLSGEEQRGGCLLA